jgi:HPt (histidine-containing phosphotransfer) domain-containing protein
MHYQPAFMQTATVNFDLLRKLLQNNKESMKKALELFVDSTEDDMEMLSAQIRNERFQEAARIAHSLKSRFVYLGNEEIVQVVKNLENMLKSACKENVKDVQNLFYLLNRTIFFCMHQVLKEIRVLSGYQNSL